MKNTRRVIAVLLAAVMCVLCFAACGKDATDTNTIDVKNAKTIADLKGAKIAAQTGTFHADARLQIEDVQGSNYPAFDDLLVALQSGAIDGYISEEPTALFATTTDSTLTFLPFKNNDTGFTTSEGDTSIAVGLKKGSELREKINEVIAGITEEQKSQLMEQMATQIGRAPQAAPLRPLRLPARLPQPPTACSRSLWSATTSPITGPTSAPRPSAQCPSAARVRMASMPTATTCR